MTVATEYSQSALPLPLPLQHLQLRLRALNKDIRVAVNARRESTQRQALAIDTGEADDSQPNAEASMVMQVLQAMNPQNRVFISDQQVDYVISEVEALCRCEDVELSEHKLRAEAKREGIVLPLDRLEFELPLSPTQMDAVLLCAAPEFDAAYEILFAFILNDIARRLPCPELFCALSNEFRDRFDRRLELGRFGRLRLLGVVVPQGTSSSELHQELRLAPGLFDFLLDGRGDPADLCRDCDEVKLPQKFSVPPHVDSGRLARVGHAFKENEVGVVGVWGPRQAGPEDVAMAIVKAADRPLRKWAVPDPRSFDAIQEQSLRDAIQVASVLDAVLWIETGVLTDPGAPDAGRLGEALADQLSVSHIRTILTGAIPWQPPRLLAARPFIAFDLASPDSSQRRKIWEQAAPEAPPPVLDELAARFPASGTEARAAAGMAATARRINHVKPSGFTADFKKRSSDDPLIVASAALERQNASRFTTVITPNRGRDDLILPEPLKSQVLEISEFHKAWPAVRGPWGFGRMMTGPGGIKALFTGDSGTGKTLAAEVIAKELGRPLLKLDLSRIVSKWVGETEKHLDAVFLEAQDRDSVLCLDEADSLLGRRGEIRQGTDRYANLEVSYLLQRLEEHPGLVVMASNHKENIDPAFMRRFQTILHFPRPGQFERAKIWRIAFPETDPYHLEEKVKIDELARLDMTGAAIVESARTAALLAAKEAKSSERPTIELAHIADAVKRQYLRDSRVLSAKELKLLGEEP
jgi:SpoVK/Ycf46/Vps4 family AAA+-type ATPase